MKVTSVGGWGGDKSMRWDIEMPKVINKCEMDGWRVDETITMDTLIHYEGQEQEQQEQQ